jgi:hypothetical protein
VKLPEKGTLAAGRNTNRVEEAVKREKEDKIRHIPEAHL